MAGIIFGAVFTLATAYALGVLVVRGAAPRVIVLGAGAVIQSTLVFGLLLGGFANAWTFAAMGGAALLGAAGIRRPGCSEGAKQPPDNVTRALAVAVFAIYGGFYAVHALAPEVQPDGIGYHLGLVAEYARLGRFPARVGFYEMVPQGLEMLFLFAFVFGRESAAKLVEFAFLAATVPMLLHLGRRLGLSDRVSLAAAVLYVCAPVCGVVGTSTYNDAALVFFVLAAFWLVLADRAALAGLAAGFCFAIKLPGVVALPAAALLVLWRRRAAMLPALCAAGAAVMAPWLLRNAVLTGNPLAPLFNGIFPNPYFHLATERMLAETLAHYKGVSLWNAPWELAFGRGLQGTLGPALLAAPVALLGWRRRAVRLCLAGALLMALPWFWNMGTRFLLLAVPLLFLALAEPLPRAAVWALMGLQAVISWPGLVAIYSPLNWRLEEFPWRAALRLEPESSYLGRLDEYKIARAIEAATRPGERIFSLLSVARAYTTRETLVYWHSATGDRLLDALRMGGQYNDALYDIAAEWPRQPLRGLRFRFNEDMPGEWCVHEIRLLAGADRIFASPQWSLAAKPNPWEVPFALDDNPATRWRTWQPVRRGDWIGMEFDRVQMATGALMVSHVRAAPEVLIKGPDGRWHAPGARVAVRPRAREDLRLPAGMALRQAGFQYLLAPTANESLAPLGRKIAAEPWAWGLSTAAQAGYVRLFRVP